MILNGVIYYTAREMAEILSKEKQKNVTRNAVNQRLHQLGIEPLSHDALYDEKALDILRNLPSAGRPKKEKNPN
jgi:transposase